MNVALYGAGGRWAMTERGRGAVEQTADLFRIGPSEMRWTGSALEIDINEIAVPHLTRLCGRITVHPEAITGIEVPLDAAEAHVWRPFAPTARIEVAIDRPGWAWQGHGYFDANFGTRALEDDFSYWTWARLPYRGGTAAFYDATRRVGQPLAVALDFAKDGRVQPMEAPPMARMARGLWTVRREARADPGTRPRQVKAMLDAPFYVRSAIRTKIHGQETVGVHEALDLDRFANPFLKAMLIARMPRALRSRSGP